MKYLLFICLVISSTVVYSQKTPVVVAEIPTGGFAPCEPAIAINPLRPYEVVVGTVLNGVHYSSDSGNTWKSATLISPYGVWGDPVLMADNKGRFYYFHLSDIDNDEDYKKGRKLDRIVCQSSDDGGITWTEGTYLGLNGGKKQDKHWVNIDNQGNIHVIWTEFDAYGSSKSSDKSRIKYSKSIDRGEIWSQPITLSSLEGSALDNSSTAEGAVPAAGIENQVFVVWSRNDSLWFNKSIDGGIHWLPQEKFVHQHQGGWSFTLPIGHRANGMPILVSDTSNSPFRGMLYLNWLSYDSVNQTSTNYFSSSPDGGKTWSTPSKIGQIEEEKPTLKFFTWMNIDPSSGYLYTVYYDNKNNNKNTFDVYLSYSKDAGLTWVEVKLTHKPFSLLPRGFFGDYNHIVALNGDIKPVWTAIEMGKQKVFTLNIKQSELEKW